MHSVDGMKTKPGRRRGEPRDLLQEQRDDQRAERQRAVDEGGRDVARPRSCAPGTARAAASAASPASPRRRRRPASGARSTSGMNTRRAAPAVRPLLDQARRPCPARPTRPEDGAEDVDPTAHPVIGLLEREHQHEGDRDRDHVDHEDPAPRQRVDEDPADHRSGDHRDARPRRPTADRLRLGRSLEGRDDDRQRTGHQQRAGDALQTRARPRGTRPSARTRTAAR